MPKFHLGRFFATTSAACAVVLGVSLVPAAVGASRPAAVHVHATPATHSFVVNSLLDAHALNAAGGSCTTSLGKCTLRAAIEVANALVVPSTITLPSGTYSLTLGALDVSDPYGVTISGKSPTLTVISETTNDRVFYVGQSADFSGSSNHGGRLILSNLAVMNGAVATGAPAPNGEGAGVLVAEPNDSLKATAVRFANNHAGDNSTSGYGGGLYNRGTTTLSNCTFSGNTATYKGGAIYQTNMYLSIDRSTFTSNSVTAPPGNTNVSGGALFIDAPSSITNSVFTSNHTTSSGSGSSEGGAIYLGEISSLTNDTFTGNSASAPGTGVAEGGAVFNDYSATIITGGSFTNNSVLGQTVYGGAWYNYAPSSFLGTKFTGNKAQGTVAGSGGAIYNSSSYTSLTLTRATFTNNQAISVTESGHQGGGALYDKAGAIITSSTFTNNTAVHGDGGAIWNAGDGDYITSSTFTGNSVTGGTYESDQYAGYGGALYLWDTSVVNSSRIVGNHASQGGGGLYSDDGNIVNDTLIQSNTANEGGGMYLDWLETGSRNAILDNVASGSGASGGGIFVVDSNGDGVSFVGTVIAGNVAPLGAGIEFGGAGASNTGAGGLTSSRVVGNHTAAGVTSECSYGSATGYPLGSADYANVAGDNSCQLSGAGDRQGSSEQGYWFATSTGAIKAKLGSVFGGAGATSALAAGPGNSGYFTVSATGVVKGFGSATTAGNAVGKLGGGSAIAILPTLDAKGYWVVSSTGAVAALGDAANFGQKVGTAVVAAARTADAKGYWLLTATGTVLTFGDAINYGHHAGTVRMAATPDGKGYWLVTTTGTVYNFGDAKPYGSTHTSGVIGITSSPDGHGYLIFSKSGVVSAKGDAHSAGSVSGAFVAVAAS